jgi:hypothetical protein
MISSRYLELKEKLRAEIRLRMTPEIKELVRALVQTDLSNEGLAQMVTFEMGTPPWGATGMEMAGEVLREEAHTSE